MPITKYPRGLSSFGVPLPAGSLPITTGTYFYVDSASGNGNAGNTGTDPSSPLATIAQALAKCTNSKCDVIVVMPGHTETLTGAGGLTINKIGVSIIGIGTGSLRPTLTLATPTTTTIAVTAANYTMKNFIITGTIAELVTVFNVTAAYCTLDGVDFAGGDTSTIKFLTTSAAATNFRMFNCIHKTTAAVTAHSWWIQLTGADDAVIENNYFHIVKSNNAGSGVLGGLTTESLRINFNNNRCVCLGTAVLAIAPLASSTGTIAYNTVGNSKTNGVGTIAPASCHAFENYETNEVTKSGMLDPVTDTNA
jgi:hypothetical protein